MKLKNHDHIAIIGGGPAGSLTACFLLEMAQKMNISLHVDIFEPRDFTATGPPGCNMCGGVVSELLMQKMAAEGISLPKSVLLDGIDSYVLHTDADAVFIRPARAEMRIASIFRGAGPLGAESQRPLPWTSFDQHFLEMAMNRGAQHIPRRVHRLARTADLKLQVFLRPERGETAGCETPSDPYDLLVGCVGLNGSGIKLFDDLAFGYRPPPSDRAWIVELYMGDEEVHRRLGNAMHIFLLNIPRLKFAAMIPKGHYATFIILGRDVDEELANQVFHAPQVRQLFPDGWHNPVRPCHCQPRISIGSPQRPFADRVVLVGDCAASRLYKDGIGAAYRMAKVCALTALTRGITAQDFKQGYWPACQSLERDNRLGHMLFAVDRLLRHFPPFGQALLMVIRDEQNRPQDPHRLGSAIWDTFTGSASYKNIFVRAAHPVVVVRLLRAVSKAIFTRIRTGRQVQKQGYPHVI
ncbi:MAG: hypothetical protein HQL87_07585 [Magnetococcales bacterium]|nr:hypothetical protein [Magnetococcales bacterium]